MLPPSPSGVRSPSGSLSSGSTPKSSGSPGYFTYNPDTLDTMKYNALQTLARELGLGGKDTKAGLIEKITAWHTKTIIHQDRSAPIQNLSMVSVPVGGASPRLLSPLKKNKVTRNVDGTPRGILSPLKRARSWLKVQTQMESGMQTLTKVQAQTEVAPPVIEEEEAQVETCAKKPRKSISFSVYNGVRLISPRRPQPAQIMPFIEPESDPDSLDFTGSSPFDDDTPPKLVSAIQLPKPSAPASCSPLQAVQMMAARIPSFISSFLSAPSASSSSFTSSPSLSSSNFSFAPSSSVSDLLPPFSIPSDSLTLPYPTCQTTVIQKDASLPAVSVVPTSQSSSFPTATTSKDLAVTATTITTTIASIVTPSSSSVCVPSSALSLCPSTPVSESNPEDLLNADSSSKPTVPQEKWSAKERRSRRCSFGEGAADKANRLASGQKPSRLSLPAAERSKRRRSSLA